MTEKESGCTVGVDTESRWNACVGLVITLVEVECVHQNDVPAILGERSDNQIRRPDTRIIIIKQRAPQIRHETIQLKYFKNKQRMASPVPIGVPTCVSEKNS